MEWASLGWIPKRFIVKGCRLTQLYIDYSLFIGTNSSDHSKSLYSNSLDSLSLLGTFRYKECHQDEKLRSSQLSFLLSDIINWDSIIYS